MLKLVFCIIFSIMRPCAFANIGQDENLVFEHYFTNPAGGKNFSNYAHKEIYFIKKQKKEGLFETTTKESFYQLMLKPDSNDSLIYLLIEYGDLSFSRDNIIAVSLSKVDQSSESISSNQGGLLFKSIISSVFYGRSKEFFTLLGDELKNKKISLDLRNSDLSEYFVKKTEKQFFQKEHSLEFKNYRKALEELNAQESQDPNKTEKDENIPLFRTVASKLKKGDKGGYPLDTASIREVKFSKIEKVKTISNFEFGFSASDFRPLYLKANSSTIFIDSKRSSFPSGEYPNKLIFSKDGKMVSFIVNNVKGYNRSRVSLFSIYKDLKNSGVKTSSFEDFVF